jgi:hypothetical protein
MMCRLRRRISFRFRRHSESEIVDWVENQNGKACHFTRKLLPQSDIGGKNCGGPDIDTEPI